MNIRYYLNRAFKISMLKLFPLSMIYYLYFMVASIVMNITIAPLITGIDKSTLQVNPFDAVEIMRNNLNAMGNMGIIKFFIAVSLAVTLLLSIYVFMDAANRFVLLETSFNEKSKFNLKSYLYVGNVFLGRFFQIVIGFIIMFAMVLLVNYALNELSLLTSRILLHIMPLFRYFIEISVLTVIAGVIILVYLIAFFVYLFFPAIVIVEQCSFGYAMKKLIAIFKSLKILSEYITFTVVIVFVSSLLLVFAMSLVSVSVIAPALYPFMFILYTFILIYTILFAEAATQLFYLGNRSLS